MTNNPSAAADQAELFRQMAAGYDHAIRVFQPTYDAMLQLSTDLACAAATSRARCLDYGTGTGAALPLLARHFDAVVGIDPGKPMLDLARARVSQELGADATRVTLVEGTTASQPRLLPPAEFDAVHCSLVLMFIESDEAKLSALRALHSTLRPSGVLVLTEILRDAEAGDEQETFALWNAIMRQRGANDVLATRGDQQVHTLMHRCTDAGLRDLLDAAGFCSAVKVFQTLHTSMLVARK
ncbi:MAG: class I SAM-dependent methyltransferase [Planctomycetes bacterium]|nr:class I SAM-dependent methyltransferase [Planctomycetota bacterium]